MPVFLTIDLGASSGRVIAAKTDFQSLELVEIHRFENTIVDLPGGAFWDILGLYRNILAGLRTAAREYGAEIAALGIDSWGCDHALLDHNGHLLGMPHSYRDPRHEGIPEKLHALMPEAEIYAHTGLTTNFYNSSVHLLAARLARSPALEAASQLLFVPDLLSYWLCGIRAVERTIASTSQLINPATGDWAWEVIAALGLPRGLFGDIIDPGTVLGPLRTEICAETGMPGVPVIATASHDTAAAVAGIPLRGHERLWLSSGTWSIMGVELEGPVTSPQALAARCCNELGVEGSVRLLRNISGLWMIQECRRHWAAAGEEHNFSELTEMAVSARAFAALVDPDSPEFASPGDMPAKVRAWCARSGQPVPEGKGAVLRCITESLALKYRMVYESLRDVVGRNFSVLHAGGGGIQNDFLTQATADALGMPVVAGPVEATSCGNVVVQMVATGYLPDVDTARELIGNSFEFQRFTPVCAADYSGVWPRFQELVGAAPRGS